MKFITVLETSTLENHEIFFKQPFPELDQGRLPRDLAVKASLAFDLRPALPRFCHASPAEQAAEQGGSKCQGEEWSANMCFFFTSYKGYIEKMVLPRFFPSEYFMALII